jgi:hypothetical protein
VQKQEFHERAENAELRRLARVKQRAVDPRANVFGDALLEFHKNVRKRQTKFAQIAAAWELIIPQQVFGKNCCLDSFTRGTLTVLVDSSSHQFELKTFLLNGGQQQLLLACRGAGLRKIQLKRGTWYVEKPSAEGRPQGRELIF